MQTIFETIDEKKPGPQWGRAFDRNWPLYKKWYLSKNIADLPTYGECLRKLKAHMPEIVPAYESLCELAGGGDLAARFLSLYNPPAYISGCSQIIWNESETRLIRNYDYSPRLLDGMILKSKWSKNQVIAISDCLIGVLDGINQHGLAVSLTFGGSQQIGKGFGIPIILRYILETCDTARQAEKALIRIPTHMAYNVSIIDSNFDFFTAHLFPEQKTIIDRKKQIATNHQPFDQNWHSYAKATATLEREAILLALKNRSDMTVNQLIQEFLCHPLYSTNYKKGFGTLYTSIYDPQKKTMEIRWPDSSWNLGFEHFTAEKRIIQYLPGGAATLLE